MEHHRIRELLTSAERHAKEGSEWPRAFDALLEAWRGSRAPEIAELCEALSIRAARGKTVHGKTQTERVLVWSRMFQRRSALGLGVLLADLDAAWADATPSRFVIPRLEALATVTDDPRVTTAMLHALRQRKWGRGANDEVKRHALAGLEASRDPRLVELLVPDAGSTHPAPRTLERLRKRSGGVGVLSPLPDELRAVATSIRDAIGAIPSDLVITDPPSDRLLDRVYEAPDDLDLRLVLADALTAAGDPRGELIVLQCRRASGESPTPEAIAREEALLEQHMRAWLGPLAPVVRRPVFARGFLERCAASIFRQVDASIHFQHPEWGTVRSIYFEAESRITPVMHALREALNVGGAALADLAGSGHPRLERLGLGNGAFADGASTEKAVAAFAACPAERLPALHHVVVSAYTYFFAIEWMGEAAWSNQIQTFEVAPLPRVNEANAHGWIKECGGLFRKLSGLKEVLIDPRLGYQLSIRKWAPGLVVRIHIDAERLLSGDSSGYWLASTLGEHCVALASADPVERVIVSATGPLILSGAPLERLRTGVNALQQLTEVTVSEGLEVRF